MSIVVTKPPIGQVLHQERRFEVRLVDVPLRSGGTEPRALLVHPGAVVVLAVTEDDRIVMIHNRRWTLGATLLELPAGTLEEGELPERCARRELREETGFEAEHLEHLLSFYAAPGTSTEVMHAFLAKGLSAVGQRLEPDEDITVELVELATLRQRMADGQVKDGKTIAVLGHYLLTRDKPGP